MAAFFTAWRSFSSVVRSERVQFRRKLTGLGICMLATISVACSPSSSPDTTTAASVVTPSASIPETTVPSATGVVEEDATTTTVGSPTSGVIVGSGGLLGWWDGDWQRATDPAGVPLEPGSTFQVVGPTGVVGMAVGGAAAPGCEIIEEHVDLDLDPSPYGTFDPFSSKPIAIDADWDLVPHPVTELPLDSAAYVEIVSDHLASRGFDDPDPELVQLFRVDLEGDGADEVVIVADNHGGEFFQQGVYSLVLVRRVIDEEVQTAVLHESIVPNDLEPDEFPFSVVARLAAFADLDDDGAMEIALDSAYYEGAGTEVWDYVDDDLGFVSVLLTGCGA